ncbi:MAG: DNA-binding protein [Taibaiella sp.]|nr:DNA-binding protein [Taibaiella sp.]
MVETYGNIDILIRHKTAFLCSRKISASAVLKCYDRAIAQREKANCVISGFHSQLEQDVLHYLLKGAQPIIVALARGLKQKIEPQFQKAFDEGRLLIVTPFTNAVKRVTEETAAVRNKLMMDLADEIVLGHLNPGGKLQQLVNELSGDKNVIRL